MKVKGRDKRPFEALKICQAVDGKHERSTNFPADCNKLKLSDAS